MGLPFLAQELQQHLDSDSTVDACLCTLVDILDEDVEGPGKNERFNHRYILGGNLSRISVCKVASKARGHGGEHPAAGKLTPNQLV